MRTKGGRGGRNFCQMKRCDIDKQKLKLKKKEEGGTSEGQAGTKTCKKCQPGIRQISSANQCFLCKY